MLTASNSDVHFQPTLFVGLGESGIRWLELIGQHLTSESQPAIQTLGIRMVGNNIVANHTEGYSSTPNRILDINWAQNSAVFQASQTQSYKWWLDAWKDANDRQQSSARLEARLAFHVMKHFNLDGRLTSVLMDIKNRLQIGTNKFLLFLLVSSAEPDSAYLGDLIFEILSELGRDNVLLCIPCCLVTGDDAHKSDLVACLRELERFTKKDQMIQAGGSSIFLGYELFNHILFLDKEEYLKPLADQLVALTNPSTSVLFTGDYANVPKPTEFSMLVSKSYSFSIPVVELRTVCAARLIKEELLKTSFLEIKNDDIDKFLKVDEEDSDDNWRFFQILGRAAHHRFSLPSDAKSFVKNWEIDPSILNKQILEKFSHFSSTPGDMLEFLKQLEEVLNKGFDELDKTRPSLRESSPLFRKVISNYRAELDKWNGVLPNLKELTGKYHNQISDKLKNQMIPSEFQQYFLHTTENMGSQSKPEDDYFSRLRAGIGWNSLVSQIRMGLDWQWTLSPNQMPYLRCIIEGQAFTEPQKMLSPLCSYAFRFTTDVAENESIFDFLKRWSSAEIDEKIDNAKPLLQYSALTSKNRRSIKCITGPQNETIVKEWRLNALINRCPSPNEKRLVYTGFDYNLPISGSNFFQKLKGSMQGDPYLKGSKSSYGHQQEQNACYFEEKLKCKTSFPATFVRLMHNREHFENIMWCIFFNWIVDASANGQESRWCLNKLEGEPAYLSLNNNEPLTLEDALVNILLKIPVLEAGGLNLFSSRLNLKTHKKITELIDTERRKTSAEKQGEIENIQQRIDDWQSSENAFYQGLAIYQNCLLLLENRKKTQKHKKVFDNSLNQDSI